MRKILLNMHLVFILIGVVLISGCATHSTVRSDSIPITQLVASLSEAERIAIKEEVSNLAISYHDAMTSLDAEDILSHVIKAPNFAYTRRGSRSNYEEFEIGTRNLGKRFTDKVSSMGPTAVDIITPEVAVVTYTFEQTLTNTEGQKRDFSGTVSWVAIKQDGEWRYIHGLSY